MSAFTDYERDVVRVLLGSRFPDDAVSAILDHADPVCCEHTGAGYFVTVRHSAVPDAPVVCSEPLLRGVFADVECGFVCSLENGHLTLECHAWGNGAIPGDIRSHPVRIEVVV